MNVQKICESKTNSIYTKVSMAGQFVTAGKMLLNASAGEEIVISGIAGCFPKSDNVSEFHDNIYNKIDLLTEIPKKWKVLHHDLPLRIGKLDNLEKFDAGFFNIHYKQAEAMDPGCRKLLEQSIEAIIDAGINPKDLQGSNTGVFIGGILQEAEKVWLYENMDSPNFGFTGSTKSMAPQWISYNLGLQGPSVSLDTACSSSLYALEHAFRAIKSGRCDGALVGGVNLLLNCNVVLQFLRLGILDSEAKNCVFDESTSGYVRSEAISIVFLQKLKGAKKVYAQVLHVKSNSDGYKKEGIVHPSQDGQAELLEDIYKELGVDPSSVNFIEAHSTGTSTGDPVEIGAIESVFCKNRKGPLLIGSVKSNMGHSEAAAGVASIIKVLTGSTIDCILPNINCVIPRKDISAFNNGNITVIQDVVPLQDVSYIGINSFGFGGANAHAVIKTYKSSTSRINEFSKLNQLVCVSGRTKQSVMALLNSVSSNQKSEHYMSLLRNTYRRNIIGHRYRGYTLILKNNSVHQSLARVSELCKPLCVVFTGPNDNWVKMYTELCQISVFSGSIHKINKLISGKGMDILVRCTMEAKTQYALLGTVAVQIAVVDTLRFLGVPLDTILGLSSGILPSTYAHGKLTLQQTVTIAHLFCSVSQKNDAKTKLMEELQNIFGSDDNHKEYVEYLTEQVMEPTEINSVLKNIPQGHATVIIGQDQECSSNQFATIHDINSFLLSLGNLYVNGFTPKLEKLYPKLPFPVKAPPNPLSLKWDHDENWFVYDFKSKATSGSEQHSISFDKSYDHWNFLLGHIIDGRNVFPATGYIYIVWETFSKMLGFLMSETKVMFENVKFHRTALISKDTTELLLVQISKISGHFEVTTQQGDVLSNGRVYLTTDNCKEFKPSSLKNIANTDGVIGNDATYRLLHLRGYNYLDEFRQISQINHSGTCSLIKWNSNWVTFLDCMIQTSLIKENGSNLILPVLIEQLSIDPRQHLNNASLLRKPNAISVYSSNHCEIIKSPGIEIRNTILTPILRRSVLDKAVLESYSFVPFLAKLSLDHSLRVIVQIVLENLRGAYLGLTEVVDECTEEESVPLTPIVADVMLQEALIVTQFEIFSTKLVNDSKIPVRNKTIDQIQSASNLVILSSASKRPTIVLNKLLNSLCVGAFILSRESINNAVYFRKYEHHVDIVAVYETASENLVLLRQTKDIVEITSPIFINNEIHWIEPLQKALKNNENVLLISEGEPRAGILGFLNSLKLEPNNAKISGVFIVNEERKFTMEDSFYKNQLQKGLTINVLRNGEWGTYRHLPLNTDKNVKCEHILGSVLKGDLESFKWIQGPKTLESKQNLIQVYCVGVNFKDIMIASGAIISKCTLKTREFARADLGMEFAGKNLSGERIMGIVKDGALSNLVECTDMAWKIPKSWSMEEAATVPLTYSTVLYALKTIGRLKTGQIILIHAGAGGIGLSAINVSLYYQCTIFVTVGSMKKRNVLKHLYPGLKDSHIGNSRDTTFERLIMKETNGKGVDVILNCLAEEKLQASLRCLARKGKFLEIGKLDMMKNNCMGLELLRNGRSFSGIHLEAFFDNSMPMPMLQKIVALVNEGIELGYVKPLRRLLFENDRITHALRYMSSGQHIGKNVIKMRDEDTRGVIVPELQLFEATPRFYCDPAKVYVIVGGLGGFGLELTNWLIQRGGTKFVLVARSGNISDYQNFQIHKWRSYGATVVISQNNVKSIKQCEKLICEAAKLGVIDGIFNLAAVLKDALFENQTEESFGMVLYPKALLTQNLDVLSRKLCPNLRLFVVFSSVSCGRGNAGQTNYCMANSIMERICELRKRAGYPALAIQWGPIKDVGMLAKAGSLHVTRNVVDCKQQRISSCLNILDTFLTQEETIVSCRIVAEPKKTVSESTNLYYVISNILGISLDHVSPHTTLAKLGLDSLSSVELQKYLENRYELFVTLKELRNITLHKLKENTQLGN